MDYNGHLRDGYYVVVFSGGSDALMDHLGIDAGYREATACTLYSVQIRVHFLKEVRAHEPLSVTVQRLGAADLTTSPQAQQPQQKRSIDVLPKPVNSVFYRQTMSWTPP